MPKKKITLKKSEVPTIFPNRPGLGIIDGVMKPRYEKDCLERQGGGDHARSLPKEPD